MEVEHETVLVFYALCRKETDGHYVFDSPYYGGGSQNGGLCHAADCELLDPLLLTKTNQPMVFTEHYYPHFETTVARFNTMYLGGVAHELGHAFGLPHDGGSKAEKYFGISLMGGGNVNYRQEVWGGGLPVYLGRASALQLASHPLITHSDRGRSEPPESVLNSLTFTTTNNMVTINGVIGGAVPPYAVIAYVWPVKARTDHQARTFQSVLHDGAFALDLAGLQPDSYHLRLARLHANGAAAHEMFRLDYTDGNTPDVAALNAQWKSR
jgi:hypothetical protein